jgi:hypothetical protein
MLVGDEVTPYRSRRSGALVATVIGVVAVFGVLAGVTGSTHSTRPRPITLVQVPPPPEATAGPDADPGGAPAPVGGVATVAEAPITSTTVAGAKAAATRPRSTVAATTPTTVPTGTVEERGAAALALINYPWPRTGFSIAFTGPNSGLLGLTDPNSKRITIYIRPTQSTRDIARVLGHEIGHSVDFTMTTDAERADYRRIRGLDTRPWYPDCSGCSDYASPVGDWAETFAYWLLGDGTFASQLAPKPTAAQLTALTPLFTADPAAVTTTTTTRTPTVTTATTAPRSTAPRSTTPRYTYPRSTTPTTRPTSTTTTTRPTSTTTTTKPTSTTTTTTTRPTTTTTTNPGTGSTSPSAGSPRRRG